MTYVRESVAMAQSHDIPHAYHHGQLPPIFMPNHNSHNRHNHMTILNNNHNYYIKLGGMVGYGKDSRWQDKLKRQKWRFGNWSNSGKSLTIPSKQTTDGKQARREEGTDQGTTQSEINGRKQVLGSNITNRRLNIIHADVVLRQQIIRDRWQSM